MSSEIVHRKLHVKFVVRVVTWCRHSFYGGGWKCSYHWLILFNLQQKAGKGKKMDNPPDFLFVCFKLNIYCNHCWSVFRGMKACTSLYFFPALLPRNHNQWFIYSLLITTEPLFFNLDQCITWTKLFTTSRFTVHNWFFIKCGSGNKVCLAFFLTE